MQEAILSAIARFARQNTAALEVLKGHIGMGLSGAAVGNGHAEGEDTYTLQARIAELDAQIDALYVRQRQNPQDDCEGAFEALYREMGALKEKLGAAQADAGHNDAERSRLDELFSTVDSLRNQSLEWDEPIIRQMVECVRVMGRDKLAIRFRLGVEVEAG